MGLLNRIVSTAVVIAVGTTLLPAVSNIVLQDERANSRPQPQSSRAINGDGSLARQTYKEYVEERLEVERLMR